MKRILILLTALLIAVTAAAQVGRYQNIDTALANAKDKLRKALKSLEESLESL